MRNFIVLLIFFCATALSKAQTNGLFTESESRFNFEETVTKLTETISTGGWKVLTVHDLQSSLKKAGNEVLPVKVFEICNPKHSYKLLSEDDERIYSSMMPCRFSVYEKKDGKVYISRMNVSTFSKNLSTLAEEVMNTANSEAESFLKEVIKH